MIAIVDYGMGNLRSVQKAFEKIGAEARVVQDPRELAGVAGIALPGVGAFGQAMENLKAAGWVKPLREVCANGLPFIGICLGMQLLFDSSEEMGQHAGLGILAGDVRRFRGNLKVPQMGWNQIRIQHPSPLLEKVPDGAFAFFVHSYYCVPRDNSTIVATTVYGNEFVSVVERENVFGAQFHPEKSQTVGLKMLENFAAITGQTPTSAGAKA